jgi:hypothetical protein
MAGHVLVELLVTCTCCRWLQVQGSKLRELGCS